jgi:integrase
MQGAGMTPEKIANTANGFYFYRAALVHHHASQIRSILNAADVAARSKLEDQWINQVTQLQEHVDALKKYRPDPNGEHLARGLVGDWAVEAEKRQRAGEKITTHSKRVRLRGLTTNWREQMFEGLGVKSKYRAPLAVLSATGARPAELELGVQVALATDGQLIFTIHGVKTHGGKYGQEVRVLTVRPETKETQFLVSQVRVAGAPLTVSAKAGALSDRIRILSAKVFPRLTKSVSAYVFRHQMAADLKASGMPAADVSAALGHSAEETKRFYGAAQSARGNGGMSKIQASRPVKERTMEKVLELGKHRAIDRARDR